MGYLSNAGLSYFFGKLKTIFAPISHGHGGATQSAAGFMSAADKKKLDGIAEGANKYSLPTATSNVLGGVKTGANITNNSGVLSVTAANVRDALGYTPPKQDTNTWRPVVNNLTSSATDQSLAANQGKILNESKAAMIVLTNENLNDVVTPGFYSSGGSNSVTNKPSNVDHFGLIVIHRASGNYYTQIVYSDSAAYRRHCVNGTWSGWVQDKLTDTDTWRGIQNNLTSDATDQSLSAAQGKVLKGLVDGKAPASHTHSQYYDSTISRTKGTVLAAPASANGGATFRTLTKSDVGLGSVDNTADSAKSVKYAASAGSATSAASATTATNDTKGQAITSYIRGLSVNGRTVTYTKGDGTTGTITTQDNNTDTKVTQSAVKDSDYTNYRSLIWGASNSATVGFTPSTVTDGVFSCTNLYVQPSSGTIFATKFKGNLDGNVAWGNVTGKPSTFAPSSHTHTRSQITDLGAAAGKNIRGLTAQGASGWKDVATDAQYVPDMTFIAYWNGAYSGSASNLAYCNRGAFGTIVTKNTGDYATAGHTHTWDSITNKPSTFAPSAHNHSVIKSLSVSGTTLTWTKDDGTTGNLTTQDTNTTYGTFKGATTSAAGSTGLVIAPVAGNANRYLRSDGTWAVPPDTNTTYGVFAKATADAAGSTGLVPAPAKGQQTYYLRGDGTWAVPANTWRGIQDNLTSASTTDSLSANQGKVLKGLIDGKAASGHTHNYAGSSSAGGAATSANKVNAALTINLNGTSQGAWDGSSAKSISITAASVGATSVTISRW